VSLIARDLPTLVFMLLPGFVAAGVFHTLTSHPKASEFERLIQALIFTTFLKLITILLKGALLEVGRLFSVGRWTPDVEIGWSITLAVPLGLIFAWFANTDTFHRFARAQGLSARTSYPSEWYGAFVREKRWVVLNLTDGRRLYGWPEEWPDQSDKGHFVLDQPQWLLDSGERAPLYKVERFMVPAADVKMVEFVKEDEEVTQDPTEVQRVERLLLSVQDKEKTDGSESAATSPQPTDQ
jgi:Family of unknown function (DUF6338)